MISMKNWWDIVNRQNLSGKPVLNRPSVESWLKNYGTLFLRWCLAGGLFWSLQKIVQTLLSCFGKLMSPTSQTFPKLDQNDDQIGQDLIYKRPEKSLNSMIKNFLKGVVRSEISRRYFELESLGETLLFTRTLSRKNAENLARGRKFFSRNILSTEKIFQPIFRLPKILSSQIFSEIFSGIKYQ